MPLPPPPPPPILSLSSAPKSGNTSRSKLLSEIHVGKRLKKTVTNDRSQPFIDKKNSTTTKSETNSSGLSGTTSISGKGGIGMLFANGIPQKPSDIKTLKIAAQKEEQIIQSNTEIPTSKVNSNNINQTPKTPTVINSKKPLLPKTNNSNINSSPYLKNFLHTDASENIIKPPEPPEKPTKIKAPPPPTLPTALTPSTTAKQPLSKPAQSFPKPLPSVINQFSQNFLIKNETIQPQQNIIKRPAAPPPPPPPQSAVNNSASTPTQQTPKSTAPLPSIPLNTHSVQSHNSPPIPPPRISSYMESVEQRFHFLAVSYFPPPPQFIGFKKIYDIDKKKLC